jgi:putative FmdB family regulatory protein
MANYDLTCRACGTDFEVFSTGFLKDEQKKCPECGSTDVQQKFTGFMCGTSSRSGASGGCPAGAGSGFS